MEIAWDKGKEELLLERFPKEASLGKGVDLQRITGTLYRRMELGGTEGWERDSNFDRLTPRKGLDKIDQELKRT